MVLYYPYEREMKLQVSNSGESEDSEEWVELLVEQLFYLIHQIASDNYVVVFKHLALDL